jgi:hypothetical protein
MKVLTIAAACLFFNNPSSDQRVDVERGEMAAFERSSRGVRLARVPYGKAQGTCSLFSSLRE